MQCASAWFHVCIIIILGTDGTWCGRSVIGIGMCGDVNKQEKKWPDCGPSSVLDEVWGTRGR